MGDERKSVRSMPTLPYKCTIFILVSIFFFILGNSLFGLRIVARKSAGTSPKVRGPVKLPSHLEQKQIPLGNISMQICTLLVLVNLCPY